MAQTLPLKTKRLKILTAAEIEDLYARPQFTDDERIWLFELNLEEQKILTSDIAIATKIDAIIRLGYFKRKQQFFQFNLPEIKDDVNHIIERYFSPTTMNKNTIGRKIKIKNQQWVLRVTKYKLFKQTLHAIILTDKASKLCKLSVNPNFLFQELLTELTLKKITRPGYSTIQKIISAALLAEQERINQILTIHLTEQEKLQLLNLLKQK